MYFVSTEKPVLQFSTSLAPMRGITCKKFQDIISNFGDPDEYFSEFLRVHATSTVDDYIIDLLGKRKSSAPLHVQLLGADPEHFLRIGTILKNFGVSSINLNFGCPMPKIGKKGVGGALLKNLSQIDKIVDAVSKLDCAISIKTRIGYTSYNEFPNIIEHLAKYNLSALYLHARTVKGMYSEDVNYDAVRLAKKVLPYKVIANGDIKTAEQAVKVIEYTKADGVMIGRAAVANPWIFRQICELKNGKTVFVPSSEDYLEYLQMLISEFGPNADINPKSLGGIKKYVVQLADSIGENNKIFLNTVRRASTIADIEDAFKKFLFI